MTQNMKLVVVAGLLAMTVSGCGEFVDGGRSPARPVITVLEGASGADPDEFGNPVLSDVITLITDPAPCTDASPCPTVFNDIGRVTMRLTLRDQGAPGFTASPSLLNEITFTRYRVTYSRSDGRNVQGVDVPYAIDGASTFTVPNEGTVAASFELVRNTAKREAPLLTLRNNADIISTLATVTFFGRDQAGNNVEATGMVSINFGNFADPE